MARMFWNDFGVECENRHGIMKSERLINIVFKPHWVLPLLPLVPEERLNNVSFF